MLIVFFLPWIVFDAVDLCSRDCIGPLPATFGPGEIGGSFYRGITDISGSVSGQFGFSGACFAIEPDIVLFLQRHETVSSRRNVGVAYDAGDLGHINLSIIFLVNADL